MRTIIGIDPGSKGFICAENEGKRVYLSIADNDRNRIAGFIRAVADDNESVVAVMEEVHAVFGSSAKATFNFGEIFGFLRGVIIACGIPYHLVQPKDWQKEIWINADKVYKSGKTIDTKATSINAAARLFPDIDFRRTGLCKGIDDNKVDATLITEYGRRKNI